MDKTNLPVKLPKPLVIYDAHGNVVSFASKRTVDKMVRINHIPPTVNSPVLGYRNQLSRDTFQPGAEDRSEPAHPGRHLRGLFQRRARAGLT